MSDKTANAGLLDFLSGASAAPTAPLPVGDSERVVREGQHVSPMKAHHVDPESYLESLNPEQRRVVMHDQGPALVAAIAGSGKTTAVVRRIAYLVRARDVPASSILAVTFSKKAADEMNTRLRKLGISGARVGTWHSLCLQIMKEERPGLLDEWEIDKRDRFKQIIKSDVLGFRGLDWKKADLGEVMNYIGLCKCELAEAGSDKSIAIAEALHKKRPCAQRNPEMLYRAYEMGQKILIDKGLLTYADMIIGAWRCLKDDDIRESWASRWEYMIQDEAQDMNHSQEVIGEMLARGHKNYMLVGDPGQSIYAFRGARPDRFLAFREEWNAETISMVRNYRSGPEIIAAANGVISAMRPENHLGDKMVAEVKDKSRVSVHIHKDAEAEAAAAVHSMMEKNADGDSWSSMACLYRTNAQSRAIEEALLSNRVPFVVIGGTNFYDRMEVKTLLAYLRVATGRATWAEVKRSMQKPFRFIGAKFFDGLDCYKPPSPVWPECALEFCSKSQGKNSTYRIQGRSITRVMEWADTIEAIRSSTALSDEHAKNGSTLSEEALQRIKRHMPAAILERVVSQTKYIAFLSRDEGSESTENNRVSNVRELIRAAERFQTVGELLDYIDENIKASKAAANDREAERVTLMSVHRSKGLEWPSVFVIGASDKIMPHGRAEDIDEERRLFYVAITRAQSALHISSIQYAPFGPKVLRLPPSPFIAETGLVVSVNG